MQTWEYSTTIELAGKTLHVWERPSTNFPGETEFTLTHQPANSKLDFVRPTTNGCWTSKQAFDAYLACWNKIVMYEHVP